MIPILTELRFSEIIPIAESATQEISLESGINAMFAENGKGKTTFCDIIERSLCSEAHAQRYSAFANKRKTKNAFIESSWICDKEFTIRQALTDGGIRTELTEKGHGKQSLSKNDYSNYLIRNFQLSLNEMQNLFQSLYYKREDDHYLLGRSDETNPQLMSFFELLNKHTSGSPDDIILRQQIKTNLAKKRELQEKIKKLDEDEERKRSIMSAIGISEISEAILDAKYAEVKRAINNLQSEIEELEKSKEELNNIIDNNNKKLYSIKDELYKVMDEIKLLKGKQITLQKEKEKLKREITIAKKVGNDKYDYIKSKVNKNPVCELCGTNIGKLWDQRIQVGCPICGTEWVKIPKEVREGIMKTEENKLEIVENVGIEEEIGKINKEIERLEEEIQKKNKERENIKLKETEIQEEITNIKVKLKLNDKEIKNKRYELSLQSKKEVEIETQKDFLISKIDLSSIISEKMSLQNKLDEIENKIDRLKEMETTTNERSQILNMFNDTTLEIFGYRIAINPKDKAVTLMADHTTRAYESLSGGEKYFIDVCLRIAVWKYLIKNGFTRQGMLIIDSPESSLDSKRLQMLANVLNHEKEDFLFIVTTRDREFFDALDANPIKMRKTVQTSLFDFIIK